MRSIFYAFTINTLFNNHLQLHILFLYYYSQIVNLQWCYINVEIYSMHTVSTLPPSHLPPSFPSFAVQKVCGGGGGGGGGEMEGGGGGGGSKL